MKKILLIISVLFSLHGFAQSDSVIYFKVPIGAGGGSVVATGAPDSSYFRLLNTTGKNYRFQVVGVTGSGTVGNTTTTTAAVQQVVTSGSITINNNTNIFIYNNASTTASATLTLPATPTDGQQLDIHFINAVTTLAIVANTGQTISQSFVVTSVQAGEHLTYNWINSLLIWIAK